MKFYTALFDKQNSSSDNPIHLFNLNIKIRLVELINALIKLVQK